MVVIFRVFGVIILLTTALSTRASVIYSTDGTVMPGFSGDSGFGGPFAPDVAMQFVATTSGVLSSITVPLSVAGGNPTTIFQVLTNVGGAPGVVLDSVTFTVPSDTPTLLTADSTTHPLLSAGTTYWLESAWTMQQRILWFGASPVVNGTVWSSTVGTVTGQEALAAFDLQADTRVPEPKTGALLTIGVLFFVRSKRRCGHPPGRDPRALEVS
jgi:hypothetical protein